MNGAESLVHPLINNGIEVCFTNPGTSEMHFVAAALAKAGVPRQEIAIKAFGGTKLLVPSRGNVNEPRNRGVEIIIR
jgi:hypothetical protein